MQRVCRSILCYVLCALLTASTLPAQTTSGGTSGAMVSGSGNVTVNGTAMGKSSAVFTGDKIQTGEASAADITAAGTTALIAANSSARYENKSIGLETGTIAISTSNGATIRTGRLLVKPVNAAAKYEVAHVNCRTMVVARQGDLALSNGAYVKQGDSITEADADCADADSQQQGAPPAPGVSAPGISNRTLAYVAVGAAATAALIAILTTERHKKSPSKPK